MLGVGGVGVLFFCSHYLVYIQNYKQKLYYFADKQQITLSEIQ